MPKRIRYHSALPKGVSPSRPSDQTEERKAAKRFYASDRWRRFRRWYLSTHPMCADCGAKKRPVVAEHVHHKEKRTARPDLAFDENNCLGLCESCHSARTARGE